MAVTATPEQIAATAKFLKPASTGVALAVEKAGGKANVAVLLNVSRPSIYRWVSINSVPIGYARALGHLANISPLELVDQETLALIKLVALEN